MDPHGDIYAIVVDDEIVLKRLQVPYPARKIKVISDNQPYEPSEIEPDQIKINGKVVWFGRELEGQGKMKKFRFSVLLCVLMLSSPAAIAQGRSNIGILFRISIVDVDRPREIEERSYTYAIERVFEKGLYKWRFEDDLIRILWLPEQKMRGMLLDLTNKSDQTIKVVWDQATYVDIDGKNHRVMHQGVKFIDRNVSQPPTIILRKSSIEDGFYPTDYAVFNREWINLPIVLGPWINSVDGIGSISALYLGKTFKFLLPLEIEGKLYEYTFTFKFYDIQMKRE